MNDCIVSICPWFTKVEEWRAKEWMKEYPKKDDARKMAVCQQSVL
jgi:hypothetical protein